jgi:C4-dicarboxylate-specific signal transduction histidine kinase
MHTSELNRGEDGVQTVHPEAARVARLTTMGELAAYIAHEIIQPLTAVVANADAALNWLSRESPDLAEAREALASIASDGARAGRIIRGLRVVAETSEPQLARLDISGAIGEALTLARGELQRHAVILRTDLATGGVWVFVDRAQMTQVLLNLIVNAIEAMATVMDRPRVLTISTASSEPGTVTVAVEDTGRGVDPARAEIIFQPLFTTKPNGTGMGLTISRSIVESIGGRLWTSPRAPHGAAFRFTAIHLTGFEAARLAQYRAIRRKRDEARWQPLATLV